MGRGHAILRGKGQGARGKTGEVVKLEDGSIGVVTGEGTLVLKEIQSAGRKALQAEDFVRGQPRFIGTILSSDVDREA